MNVIDIEKAQASTLKKGIDTKRQTNPLMPNYQFLGNLDVNKWWLATNNLYLYHFQEHLLGKIALAKNEKQIFYSATIINL